MMIPILIIVFSIVLDQVVKVVTTANLNLNETFPLIKDVFHITYVENTGAAFSILDGKMTLFYIITPIAIIGFSYYLIKNYKESKLQNIAIAMIIGGAIGNFIDRVVFKYVRDMFDFRLINFAVFNVADIFLVIGTGLFVFYLILGIIKEHKKTKNENSEPNE